MKNLLSSLEKDSEDIKAYKIKLNNELSVADQKITLNSSLRTKDSS